MSLRNIILILSCLFLFILAPIAAAAPAAQLSDERTYSLFNQANQAFRQANASADKTARQKLYEKAILSYEKIINDGQISNSGLYYNLGNAYLLSRDIGRAILNYRRAEKQDNADANIKKNLAFARSRRFDKINVKTEKRVLQTLFFWHYDFSMKTKFLITCICFAVLCASLTTILWLSRTAPLTVTAVISCLLTICFFASMFVENRNQTANICGVITADEIVARQGDGRNYPESFKESLHAGTEFDLLESRSSWLHIKLPDDSEGWIPQNSADLI